MPLSQPLSSLTVAAVGLLCKAFLRFGCREVRVEGVDVLLRALEDEGRRKSGRGVMTVCNHISVMDDPIIWGIMPTRTYLNPDLSRWTLGASDIIFTNPVYGAFFRAGQVFETFRGGGINQPAVDDAIRTLNAGRWIHIFPEGKINQPCYNPTGGLFPFKWGMGKMIMEAKNVPLIIPMWIRGTDQIMPEPRHFPSRVPLPGKKVSITFSHDPALNVAVSHLRDRWFALQREERERETSKVRSGITDRIRESVGLLRDRVERAEGKQG